MPNKLNILIVEDELLIAEMLKEILLELNCTVLTIAQNYDSAILAMESNTTIDLIFLDINLSEKKSGFTFAEKINTEFQIPFLFLTSYSDAQTIQNAAQYKPHGYLIKPFSKADLLVTLELFKAKNPPNHKILEIKDGHFTTKINHADILWVKSENNYLEIQTQTKRYVIRNSFEKFLKKTNDENFIRVHRSYVINLQHVKAVNRVHVIVNNEKIPISRKHHDILVQKFSK